MRRDKSNSKKVTVFKKKGPAFKEAKSTSPKVTFTKFVYSEKEKAEREIRNKISILVFLISDEDSASDFHDPIDKTFIAQLKSLDKEYLYNELEKLDAQLYAL